MKSKLIEAMLGDKDETLKNLFKKYSTEEGKERERLCRIIENNLSNIRTDYSPEVEKYYRDIYNLYSALEGPL